MDGLSAAASVIAVIDVSAKIISLCLQYSTAVKNSRKYVERLQKKVSSIKNVFGKVEQLLDEQDERCFHLPIIYLTRSKNVLSS